MPVGTTAAPAGLQMHGLDGDQVEPRVPGMGARGQLGVRAQALDGQELWLRDGLGHARDDHDIYHVAP